MTHIYFVRHAKPVPDWSVDRERQLSDEGRADSRRVTELFDDIHLDCAASSPYIRSVDTIRECAERHGLAIHTDDDFRERRCGDVGDRYYEYIRLRWEDHDFCEDGGETLREVQKRNMRALKKLLGEHEGDSILLGTHGTALSMILNHYDPGFGYDDFMRIIGFMPYVIRADFDGQELVGMEELLIIEK